jgi:hypothetical protein
MKRAAPGRAAALCDEPAIHARNPMLHVLTKLRNAQSLTRLEELALRR